MAADGMTPNLFVGLERKRQQITTYVDAYYWRCAECGWLGTGHFSLEQAMKEAGRHWQDEHHVELASPPTVERRDVRPLPPLTKQTIQGATTP